MIHAYVLVDARAGHEGPVVERLRSVFAPAEVAETEGAYDAIVRVSAEDPSDLDDLLERRVRGVAGVLRALLCPSSDSVRAASAQRRTIRGEAWPPRPYMGLAARWAR